MNNNLISVIVPVYNLENYIERCLKSIQNQTYSNIEIIVVDDGSIDDSWNVINRIAKEDNRIIPVHKENGGVSSARMLGLDNANGEWIGFVDGDDEIEEDMYEVLINNAFECNADISHCGYKMIFNDGRITSFYDTKVKKIQDNITGVIDLLEGDLIEPGLSNKLYKKSLFEDIELDTNIKINEDLLLNYYLFKNSQLSIFEDLTKYHYLIRDNSASRSKLNDYKIYDPIRVKEVILNDADDEYKSTAQKVFLRTLIYVYNSLIINEGDFVNDKKKIRKMIFSNRCYCSLLNSKLKIMTNMIMLIPNFYKIIYKIYYHNILKSKY